MLFNGVYNEVDSFYNSLVINNKSFQFVDVTLKEQSSTHITFDVLSFVVDGVTDSDPTLLVGCASYFDEDDCYNSGIGDEPPFWIGGECDEDLGQSQYDTDVQFEIQKAINSRIPKYVRSHKGVEGGTIVYNNMDCSFTDIRLDQEDFGISESCGEIDFIDELSHPDAEYEGYKLDCTVCIILDLIAAYTPEGMVLAEINIRGELAIEGGEIVWLMDLCFGEPKLIVATEVPQMPQFTNG